jgi:hypothetical protein
MIVSRARNFHLLLCLQFAFYNVHSAHSQKSANPDTPAIRISEALDALPDVPHRSGRYEGKFEISPSEPSDGVHWIVQQEFSYADGFGHTLTAEQGFSTDGASIPRVLWTFVGSPFTGKYPRAAVIHDVGCVTHKYTWQETDRIFFDAMLDAGVSDQQAKLFYWAVRAGGPRWTPKLIVASSKAELAKKISQSKAEPIDKAPASSRANAKSIGIGDPLDRLLEEAARTKDGKWTVPVAIRQPSGELSEAQLKAFDLELKTRERAGHPLTLREIEKRTP